MIKILLSTLLVFAGLCEKNTTTIPSTTTFENVTQTTLDNHPPYVDAGQDPIIVKAHVGEAEKYPLPLDTIKDPDHDDLIYQVMYGNTTDLPSGVSFTAPMLAVEGVKQAAYNLTLVGTDPYGASAKLPILLSVTPHKEKEKIIEEDTLSIIVLVGTGSFLGICLPAAIFYRWKENNVMKYLSVIEVFIGGAQILTAALSIFEGERIYNKLIIGAGVLNIVVGGILLIKGMFDFITAYREEKKNYATNKHKMSISIKICLAVTELASGGILIYADFTQVDELMSKLLSFFAALNATSSFLINLIDSWEQNKLFKELKDNYRREKIDHQLDSLKNEISRIIEGIERRNDHKEDQRKAKRRRERKRKSIVKMQKEKIDKIEKEPLYLKKVGQAIILSEPDGLPPLEIEVFENPYEAQKEKRQKIEEAETELQSMINCHSEQRRGSVVINKNERQPDSYYAVRKKMEKYGVTVSLKKYSKSTEAIEYDHNEYHYDYNLDDTETYLCSIKEEIQTLSKITTAPQDFFEDL